MKTLVNQELPRTICAKKARREKGAVIALFAAAVLMLLLSLALAIDLGVAYVASSTLSKAVDAGALAAARYSSGSQAEVQDLALKVAAANFPTENFKVKFKADVTYPTVDTVNVSIQAAGESPAILSSLLGKEKLDIASAAEATRNPLDMSLILDLSYSLQRNGVFDDMQDASKAFVEYFNDTTDQVGLVTYSTWAEEKRAIGKSFKTTLTSTISGLSAISDTNIEEGLRVSKNQMDDAPYRDNAIKVIVLFTDGRPTAYADDFYMNLSSPKPDYYTGILATYISGDSVRGLFQVSDGRKVLSFSSSDGSANTTSNGSRTASEDLPHGVSASNHGDEIRSQGAAQAEDWADVIRSAGYTIYTVALGNPSASYDYDKPDLDFLERIANQDGIVDSSQPKGEMMFAPSAAELDAAFAAVADRILTRLTK